MKLTGYIAHQTTSSWRNQLQVLYVGNRDRASEAGVDSFPVNSYATVDFTSTFEIGAGELSIGIGNLFNNQFFPVISQVRSSFGDNSFSPGRGRTLSVNYKIDW